MGLINVAANYFVILKKDQKQQQRIGGYQLGKPEKSKVKQGVYSLKKETFEKFIIYLNLNLI